MANLRFFSTQRFLRGGGRALSGLMFLGSSLACAQQPVAPTVTPAPIPKHPTSDTAKKPTTKPTPRTAVPGPGKAGAKAGGKEDHDSRSPPTRRDERGPTGTGTGTGNDMGPT